MLTTHYGHACLKLEGPGGACLIDPWLSREGAFFHSWFQFPENHPWLDQAIADVRDLCLSHNHHDHLDLGVFRRLFEASPDLKLHIARFATDWFRRRLERFFPGENHRIIEHAAFEPFELACGGTLFFVPEESPGQIDSCMVWTDGQSNLVNLNDARLNTAQFRRIKDLLGTVDVFCLQGSGASEYPINYDYAPEDMLARKLEKRRTKLEACERMVDLLEPRRLLFFAGPPVFLDPDLDRQNDLSETSVFPDQLNILQHFAEVRPDIADRAWFLLPGDALDDDRLFSKASLADPRWAPYTDKARYVAEYRQRRLDLVTFDPGEIGDEAALLEHFVHLARVSPWISEKIGGCIDFVIAGRRRRVEVGVDFQTGTARLGRSEDPFYVLTAPASSVAAVLSGEATWDDVMLSIRMHFQERSPRFIAHFKTLLKFPHAPTLDALRRYEESLARTEAEEDMIEIEHEGCRYRIQRRCPHAGVDLTRHGRVEDDGTITCMAHRFRFDLATGRCLNTKGFDLKVEAPR